MSSFSALTALSPIDGHYAAKADPLYEWLSKVAFMCNRVKVEVHWLVALLQVGLAKVPRLSAAAEGALLVLAENFAEADAARIKEVEAVISRDVKAVEYWMEEYVHGDIEPRAASEFIHSVYTSEDINSTSHDIIFKGIRGTVIVPALRCVQVRLVELAHVSADVSMLSRTHDQPAGPITLDEEMANVTARLDHTTRHTEAVELLGKMNGATSNYNTHLLTYPSLGWEAFPRNVIEMYLGLTFNPYTIQTELRGYMAELLDVVIHANAIVLDLDRDVQGYVSQGHLKRKTKAGEIDSFTTSHKVGLIDFENFEDSVDLADMVLCHLPEKLPVSYW